MIGCRPKCLYRTRLECYVMKYNNNRNNRGENNAQSDNIRLQRLPYS